MLIMDGMAVSTVCPFCGVGCGMRLLTADGRVTGVQPMQSHPVSRGQLCAKGWNADKCLQAPGRVTSPLLRRNHWELYRPLDVAAMREGAKHFLGEHDFSAFRAADCPAKTTRRVMRRFDVEGERDLVITVEATAFLKQMVRNLVGTLVEVGIGRRPPESIAQLLLDGDRTKAGPTAPPQGLTMAKVFYEGR